MRRRDRQASRRSPQSKTKKVRIFQVSDVEWWAGESAESVSAAYRECVGERAAREVSDEFGAPQKVAAAKLDVMTVTEVDEPGQPKHTFRKILDLIRHQWDGKPTFVASTEY